MHSILNDLCFSSTSCYYLVDASSINYEAFFAHFRGELEPVASRTPTKKCKDLFNLKHASVHNVIERCFCLFKIMVAIRRSPSLYPIGLSLLFGQLKNFI